MSTASRTRADEQLATAALAALSLAATPASSSSSVAPAAPAVRAPFRPTKVLGENVVVLRHLSKKYVLAGKGGADGRGEEVVALRHVNLIPLGEEPEADAAEELRDGVRHPPNGASIPRDIGASSSSAAAAAAAHAAHMHPIRRGEFVMIRGPSGGGKTTLLNILGTIDEASSGSVEMFGSLITPQSRDSDLASLRLNKIGFVFQTFNLLATMSAFENVELPMVIRGKLSRDQCKARALELLDRSLRPFAERIIGTIARALANEPELLLLDEPTGDLDSRNTVDVMDLILSINQGALSSTTSSAGAQPTTVIMVTHNPDLECYADRILYVEDGAFKKQAINRTQRKIDYAKYLKHINQQH